MIKKVGCFIFISVLLLSVSLIVSNYDSIIEALSNYPIDRIICYLLGAVTSYVVFQRLGKQKKKTQKTTSVEKE